MDPLSIIASVIGVVTFAATSTKNLLAIIDKTRGAPAAIRGTARDAAEFLAVLQSLEELLGDDDLKRDETIQNVLRGVEGPIRSSQDALDELMEVVEASGGGSKWNGLKWAFRDERNVRGLNERLVMSKTTLSFALTTINTLNQVRLNKTQGLISDQIRGLRIDLEAQELSSVRVRKDSGWHGTDVGFALQRFLNDTNTEIVESPSGPSQSWADCSDALTFGQGISFDHSFASDRNERERHKKSPLHSVRSQNLWAQLEIEADINAVDPNEGPLLHRAIQVGDLELVREILNRHADIEIRNEDGGSPLIYATWEGQVAIARLLLEKGANIDASDDDKHAACHVAAELGDVAMLNLLIERGPNINATEVDGWTPLYSAAVSVRADACKVLIAAGANVEILAIDGTSCLHAAALKGSIPVLEQLLVSGANVDFVDASKNTPLHIAASKDFPEAVTYLLGKGAAREAREIDGRTPLFVAAQENCVKSAQALLLSGVDIEAKDSQSRTSLSIAAVNDHLATVQVLIDFGSKIDVPDIRGQTALHHAVMSQHSRIVQLLLEAESAVDATIIQNKYTSLHLIAARSDTEIARILVAHGAEIDARADENSNDTPLLVAVQRKDEGRTAMALCLMEMGASVDLVDTIHRSALHWTAENGPPEVVDALLEKGAIVSLVDDWGQTPIFYALENCHDEIIKSLIKKGSDPLAQNQDQETLLWKTMQRTKISDEERVARTMALVVEMGADIEALEDTYSKTSLIWAAEDGHLAFVKCLLNQKANVAARDCFGMTALHYAAENGHLDCVESLVEAGSDVDARTDNSETPMWKAYHGQPQRQQEEVMKYLMSHSPSPSDTLIILIQLHKFPRAQSLISSGKANIPFQWPDKKQAIHFACSDDAAGVLRLLVENKVDVNCEDDSGTTPLIYALKNGSLDATKILIENCADLRAAPVLVIAAETGNSALVSFLLLKGIDSNAVNAEGETALHVCCRKDRDDITILKLLVQHGASLKAEDGEGRTVKKLAEENDCDAVLRWLAVWELDNKEREVKKARAGDRVLNMRRFKGRGDVGFEMLGRPTW